MGEFVKWLWISTEKYHQRWWIRNKINFYLFGNHPIYSVHESGRLVKFYPMQSRDLFVRRSTLPWTTRSFSEIIIVIKCYFFNFSIDFEQISKPLAVQKLGINTIFIFVMPTRAQIQKTGVRKLLEWHASKAFQPTFHRLINHFVDYFYKNDDFVLTTRMQKFPNSPLGVSPKCPPGYQ